MLTEIELRNLIKVEWDRHEFIVDPDARGRHYNFILGLEAVLND